MTTHDDLAGRAERGELPIIPGTEQRGTPASRTETQRRLMEATGATSPEDAVRVAVGRPRLGAGSGASPVLRARVPQPLKDRVSELAGREHRAESDIVRAALEEYLAQRHAS